MNDILLAAPTDSAHWRRASAADLIEYLITRFHERHRVQLPELVRLARRVEHTHAGKPSCPSGLADVLETLYQELESHMLKEEQVLFPMLARGMHQQARAPISVMRFEHEHHFGALEEIGRLTDGLAVPPEACNTWRALYGGLQAFQEDLTQHIHLENDVLFLNSSHAAEGARDA